MQKLLETYNKLNSTNLDLLDAVYSPQIQFIDPVHELHGLDDLKRYFRALYQNVQEVSFTYHHQVRTADEGYVQWEMRFSHPRIKHGKQVSLPGVSFLCFNEQEKIFLHRDYYDLGAMLYEHLPLLGGIISTLKRRLRT